jgi:anti-anti-sigma factor
VDREPIRIDESGIRPPDAFAIWEEPVGGALVLRLEGELDLAACDGLRARVDAAAGRPLVFDMAEVTFVDSSALRELLRAQMECERRGDRLVVAALPAAVTRLLGLTRTATLFEIAPTREAALARVGAHA